MKKVWYAPNRLEAYGEKEIKAVEESLRAGWLAGFGPRTIEFEEKIAKEFGKKFGVFVNSGSSACLLALAALDLPKGSKIVTPALTFSTTLAPIIQLGFIPIFIDSNLTSYVPTVEDMFQLQVFTLHMLLLQVEWEVWLCLMMKNMLKKLYNIEIGVE